MTSGGRSDDATKVKGEGTMITDVPSISVFCPGMPKGAAVAGMVIGFGMMTLTPNGDKITLDCGSFVAQVMIWQIAIAIRWRVSSEGRGDSGLAVLILLVPTSGGVAYVT
jgi:hypothetical protein